MNKLGEQLNTLHGPIMGMQETLQLPQVNRIGNSLVDCIVFSLADSISREKEFKILEMNILNE